MIFLHYLSFSYGNLFKLRKGLIIKRLNYNWEDDAEFDNKNFDWNAAKLFGEFNILNFHPIHIYLNSKKFLQYNNLLKELSNKKLYSAKKYIG